MRDPRDQLEVILRGVADGITAQDPSGRLVYANEAAARVLGYSSAGELVEAPPREVLGKFEVMDESGGALPPEELPGRRALQGEESPEVLLRFRVLATGAERWAIVKARPVFDDEGRVRLAINIFRDVTERRRAEEALKKSEERFRLLVQNSSDVISVFDADGTILYESPSMERVLGYKPEERIGKNVFRSSLVHPDETGEKREVLDRVLGDAGAEATAEFRVRHADGSWRYVEAIVKNLLHEPSIGGVVVNYRDITERKRAEEALRRAEEKYRGIFENVIEGILQTSLEGRILTSLEGRVLTANFAMARILGYDSPEDLTSSVSDVARHLYVDPGDRTEFVRLMREHGAVSGFETRVYRKDGTMIWISVNARAVVDVEGNLVGFEGTVEDVTKRKRAEEELRRSEERYRTIVQTANEGVWLVDAEASTLYANDRMARILGYDTAEEMIGRRVLEFCFPEDVSAAEKRIGSNMRGVSEQFDFRFRRKGGGEVLVLACTSPVRDERGEAVGALGLFTDVTARKRAEEALRDSEERYRLLFESNPNPMWVYDLETLSFLAVNGAAIRHYGYSRAEFLSMTIGDIRPEEEVPALLEAMTEGTAEVYEAGGWRHRKKDGTIIDVEITTHTFVFAGRRARLVLAHDVTERKRTEEALRFQKILLEAQGEASIDGILVVSDSGEILSFNRRFVEMWGIPEKVMATGSGEAALQSVEDKLVDPQKFFARVEYLYEHPGEESREEIALKDGRTFDRYSAPVKSADGTHYGRVWYFRDITERKRMEGKLAQSLRSKTEFLADVSHELRTPLTTIRVNAEAGLEIERDCAHVRLLEEIAEKSARMSRLVEDLLFLARSDSDSPPMKLKPVDIPPFLTEVAERAEALARQRGATFEAALSGEGRLRIDQARIEQAVLILVDNAAKYSPPGECVTMTSSTRDGELCIRVEDRGAGIPEADLPHIFERFYRGDAARSNKRSQGGSGLGLAIAKTIMDAHGGRIEAASRVVKGTRMALYLPVISARRPVGKGGEGRVERSRSA